MSTELIKRGAITLGALLVWRLGTYIPLPGVDLTAWAMLYQAQSGGVLGQANALSGGALHRLGILSLSLTPYLTSAVILQLLSMVSRALRRLADDEPGRRKLELATVAGTVLLAVLQSYGIALGLEAAGTVVPEPGLLFRLTTVVTLTAGTLVLVWLAGQITARGLGNGIALILATGIVTMLPSQFAGLLELNRQGVIAPRALAVIALVIAGSIALVVAVERARRRLPVEFAERRIGMQRQTADIALKLNPAGLMPVFMVAITFTIVLLALSFASLIATRFGWFGPVHVSIGEPVRLVATAVLMVLFTFLYTAFVCGPDQMAARLAACGGALPGIAPGEPTAAYLDRAISRSAAIGAIYLVVVMLVPELVALYFALPGVPGGMPILVLVCAALDLTAEIKARRAHAE
jgi:preprotein translocase subunit SecY